MQCSSRGPVVSVAWPQKTVKGLGPPGGSVTADPCTEFGQRRARVRNGAKVGSCKTPMRGPWSHRRLLNERHRKRPYKGLPESGRPLCVFPDSVWGAWESKTVKGLGRRFGPGNARQTQTKDAGQGGPTLEGK